MENKTTIQPIKVYRDGKYDAWTSMKPYLVEAFNKVDYFFVNGRWPRE